MKHSASHELFTYWNHLRGARAAPERSEIDPAAIRTVLADTFMLEVDPERRFHLRLSGTRLNMLFDAEQKGRSFDTLWCAPDAPIITTVLASVVDEVLPAVLSAMAAPPGHAEIEMELLFLPLRHYGKTHARVLGLISPTRHASWYGLLPIEPLRLHSMRIINDLQAAQPITATRPTYFAPAPRNAAVPQEGAIFQRHKHLRIYSGGR